MHGNMQDVQRAMPSLLERAIIPDRHTNPEKYSWKLF